MSPAIHLGLPPRQDNNNKYNHLYSATYDENVNNCKKDDMMIMTKMRKMKNNEQWRLKRSKNGGKEEEM